LSEVLPHSITGTVTLRSGSATSASTELLTEREIEDAVTPHLTRPRAPFSVFKEQSASRHGHVWG
jgi:hypothetical protein